MTRPGNHSNHRETHMNRGPNITYPQGYVRRAYVSEVPCPDCDGTGGGARLDVDRFSLCERCKGWGDVPACNDCGGHGYVEIIDDDPEPGPTLTPDCDDCDGTGAEGGK